MDTTDWNEHETRAHSLLRSGRTYLDAIERALLEATHKNDLRAEALDELTAAIAYADAVLAEDPQALDLVELVWPGTTRTGTPA